MKYLLVLFVVAAFFATGEALRCYECSQINANCNDPFDKSADGIKVTTFPPGCFCAKLVAEAGNEKATMRSCFALPTTYNSRAGEVVDNVAINLCSSDLCNGASSITITQITLAVLAMPLLFMIWH